MIHKKHVPRNGIIYFWFNSSNYKPCTLPLPSKRIYQRDGHGYNEGVNTHGRLRQDSRNFSFSQFWSFRTFQNNIRFFMQGKEQMRHKDKVGAFLGNHWMVLMLDSFLSFSCSPGRLLICIHVESPCEWICHGEWNMPSRKGNTQLSPFIYCKGVNCIYNLILYQNLHYFPLPQFLIVKSLARLKSSLKMGLLRTTLLFWEST